MIPANRFMRIFCLYKRRAGIRRADPGSLGCDCDCSYRSLLFSSCAAPRGACGSVRSARGRACRPVPACRRGAARAGRRAAVEDRFDRLDVRHGFAMALGSLRRVRIAARRRRLGSLIGGRRHRRTRARSPRGRRGLRRAAGRAVGAGDAVVRLDGSWRHVLGADAVLAVVVRAPRWWRRAALGSDGGPPVPLAAPPKPSAAPPPAAFSNSIRCERNSIGFALMAGSTATCPTCRPRRPCPRAGPGPETHRRAARPRAR